MHGAGYVNDMAFSADSRWFATSGMDGTVRIWTLTIDDLITNSCARLTRNLSELVWHQLLGDEPYTPVCPDLPVPKS